MNKESAIAEALLKTGAVKLNVKTPFTFVSGIKSPIYCDNRQMIAHPAERRLFVEAFLEKLKGKDYDILAGTATAGIPWAAFLAWETGKPMSYIRAEKKDHGAGKQVEGADLAGKNVIIIEDLISTGGSSLKTVEAAFDAGAANVSVLAIFSYEFPKAEKAFAEKGVKWETISNFPALIAVACEKNYLTKEEADAASAWNKAPDSWGR